MKIDGDFSVNQSEIQKIKKVSKEFEKFMIKSIFKFDPQLKGSGNYIYSDMLNDILAEKVSEKGTGLSEYIFRHLSSQKKD